jgi:ubiquinone/menaquinone biosynthesis C-methylase UbiE
MRLRTPWIFTLGAGVYDALTAQEGWQRHCRQMASQIPGEWVLDLGIGPGVSGIEIARAAPGRHLIGLDCSAQMLARARQRVAAAGMTLPLVRADASRLPFAEGSYDGATGHSFLYLLEDSEAVLKEVYRVLRPGGGIAFLEPNSIVGGRRLRAVLFAYRDGFRFGTLMLLWSVFSGLYGRYSRRRLIGEFTRCGFSNVQVSSEFGGLGLLATADRL